MNALRFWGKAPPHLNNYHLLEFHSLDVVAVLREYLKADRIMRQRIERLAPCSYGEIVPILEFFAAIHDIGKFGRSFQFRRADIAVLLGHPRHVRSGGAPHHTKSGWWFYMHRVMHREIEMRYFAPWRSFYFELLPLAMAALGHHGKPVDHNSVDSREFEHAGAHAIRFVDAMAELFLPLEPPQWIEDEDMFRPLSWLFAGLMVLSDWIGSSEAYFPYRSEPMDAREYFNLARKRAREAVGACGLLHPPVARQRDFASLLPQLKGHSPRALQRYAMEQAVINGGSQLHIFEDLTGCGKTEAALLCAYRLMEQGACSGLYVGLPTMATANAMYHRLGESYRTLFAASDDLPSLMLAHGHRRMEEAFLGSIALEGDAAPRVGEGRDVTCSQWLADNRKKALLAPCGAGTLDQALLSILPARHQSLRLAGVSRVVLIADEVHSYDLYTGELLARLLTFIAAMGSSAILLTATLPRALRLELVRAFQRGLGRGESEHLNEDAFPLATRVDASGNVSERKIGGVAVNGKTTAVELVHAEDAMFTALAAAGGAGACACWVRNTVDQAIDAAQRLVAVYGLAPERVILAHARFAMCDRLALETEILRRFGKDSSERDRAGYILVGSQMLEQSLDYDVDLMLSDLAPMDALIQRAGRCHRHKRARPEGYAASRLVVLSPELVENPTADWYGALLGKAGFVYRKQALLWLTARLLCEKGSLVLPQDARVLMEGAYGEELQAPQALLKADAKAEGEELGDKSLAFQNALDHTQGYASDASRSGWSDDTSAATRIGDERVQLRLCRVGAGGKPELWAGGAGAKACALSEVSVSARKVGRPDEDAQDPALRAFAETMPDKGRWVRLVLLQQSAGSEWTGRVPCKGKLVRVRYSRAYGLVMESD